MRGETRPLRFSSPFFLGVADAARVPFDAMARWVELRRQRRALAALPDHLLRDVGLSRADVESEIAKPFWRG